MSRLMLIGTIRGRPDYVPSPAHAQIFGGDWTGLALELDDALDLDFEDAVTELARIQHEILCQYIVTDDVFPVALGAVFSSRQSIAAHLEQDTAELDRFHSRLGHHVEYTLTVNHTPPQTPPPASTGTAHLRERLAKRDRAKQSSRRIGSALQTAIQIAKDLGAQHHVRSGQSARAAQRIDFLLNRNAVDKFTERLAPVARAAAHEGVQLSLIGPYPAFSFLAGPHGD